MNDRPEPSSLPPPPPRKGESARDYRIRTGQLRGGHTPETPNDSPPIPPTGGASITRDDLPQPAVVSPKVFGRPSSRTVTSFEDAKGRVWELKLTLGIASRLSTVDFSEITKEKFDVVSDPSKVIVTALANRAFLFAYIWQIVYPQAKSVLNEDGTPFTNFDEDDFIEAIDGPTIQRGSAAFLQAVYDFFPDQRTSLEAIVEEIEVARRTLTTKQAEAMKTGMKTQTAKILEKVDASLKELGDPSSTS